MIYEWRVMNMRNNTYILYVKATLAALLLAPFLLACSEDSDGPVVEEAKYARLVISLGSLDNSTPAYTRANDIDPDDDGFDTEYERKIDDWWVVVVNSDGNVYTVLSNTKNNTAVVDDADEQNRHTISVELLIGERYTFYAFANLRSLEGGDKLVEKINGLSTDDAFYDFRKEAVTLLAIGNYKEGEKSIPMSSYGYTRTIAADNNTLEIPLIRLLSKVSIVITNGTESTLTVKSLKMGKFRRSGSIYLLPYDAIESDPATPNLLVSAGEETALKDPQFPGDNETLGSDWEYPKDTPLGNVTGDKLNAKNGTKTYSFYINETCVDNQDASGDMNIAIEVDGDIEKNDQPQTAKFSFVRRNDWLKIPVLLSNAQSRITVSQQHMPIGGLPTELEFPDGAIISDKEVELDHAGIVTIGYELGTVNGESDWSLKYYESTIEGSEQFCCAQVEENSGQADGKGLILVDYDDTDDESGESLWTTLHWIPSSPYGFTLTPDKETDGTTDSKTSGSFKVRIQELSSGTAKVKLTLVATNGTSEITLPYTITLNYKGGN